MSLGARLLAKMGYQEGKGLGKDGSGLLAPLVHEKTGMRSGVIKVADGGNFSTSSDTGSSGNVDFGGHHTFLSTVAPAAAGTAPFNASSATSSVPSRIVLLTNMVGPGEADDELEGEVREECSRKYGPVEAVFIYEAPAASVPREEAVRIIVAFQAVESAVKAQGDLNGRFFGGHAVRASFFAEERFARFDFAP